jgi:hypothetical protein
LVSASFARLARGGSEGPAIAEEVFMHRRKIPGLAWSPDDEAVFKRWRRALCIFYGCLGIILIAAWGVPRLVGDDQRRAAPIDHSPPTAIVIPAQLRH